MFSWDVSLSFAFEFVTDGEIFQRPRPITPSGVVVWVRPEKCSSGPGVFRSANADGRAIRNPQSPTCPIQFQLPQLLADLRKIPHLQVLAMHSHGETPAISAQADGEHASRQH